jgi:putative transposase
VPAPLISLTRDEMETRRLAAASELLNGASQAQVARRYGVSRTTASRWCRSVSVRGVDSMRKRRATGRPSRLTADQIHEIRKMYEQGARAWGFSTERWTTGRLAQAIERGFGIRYDCDHVGRLMHKFGLREKRHKAIRTVFSQMPAAPMPVEVPAPVTEDFAIAV